MMSIQDFILTVSIIAGVMSVPGVIVWLFVLEIRRERRKEQARRAEREAWLADEMKKPKSYLKVIIEDDIEILSADIDPMIERGYRSYFKYTSKEAAEHEAARIMKGGGFRKGNQFWPHQVIKKVTVLRNEE